MTVTEKKAAEKKARALSVNDFGWSEELERVELPELGGYVYMRPVSAGALIDVTEEGGAGAKTTLRIIQDIIVDENGQQLFDGPEGEKRLRSLRVGVYGALSKAAMKKINEAQEDSEGEGPFEGVAETS